MNLGKKKKLAIRALNVGKDRIIFNKERINEIKEAITNQDIRDLKKTGAIIVLEKKGIKKKEKRKTRRRAGSRKKKVGTKKQDYVKLTRKLRSYLLSLKRGRKISSENFYKIRKEIKASEFRSLSHMKEKIIKMNEEK